MSTPTSTIRFKAKLYTLKKWTILRLPEKESEKMPSRGQVAVTGTINGKEFQTVLEPDGYWGHWMRVDTKLQKLAGISDGDTATLELTPTKNWPEPTLPKDLADALEIAPARTIKLYFFIHRYDVILSYDPQTSLR